MGYRAIRPLRDFLRTEAAGSALILIAIAIALLWANSPWDSSYHDLWSTVASIGISDHVLALDLQHWVSDGAMTVFFLVVGLEIKREFTVGELRDRRAAAVPVIAAVGGIAVPGLLYLAIASGTPRGWAVPTATDIALAVGALSILSTRVPGSLRAFLLTLAIVDDIAAVLVIAIFYSDNLDVVPLVLAGAVIVIAALLRARLTPGRLLLCCAVLWLLLHEAGVHATLAGVITGILAPLHPHQAPDLIDAEELTDLHSVRAAHKTVVLARQSVSTLEWLEHRLHPWSTMLVVPLFALANAGISLTGDSVADAAGSRVAWAVVIGLVIGKPLGIWCATMLATRVFGNPLPRGADARDILGIGALGGIGFTISLVIAKRAFPDVAIASEATLAILIASLLAATAGLMLLRRSDREPSSVD